jgi:hypothetical protein
MDAALQEIGKDLLQRTSEDFDALASTETQTVIDYEGYSWGVVLTVYKMATQNTEKKED